MAASKDFSFESALAALEEITQISPPKRTASSPSPSMSLRVAIDKAASEATRILRDAVKFVSEKSQYSKVVFSASGCTVMAMGCALKLFQVNF